MAGNETGMPSADLFNGRTWFVVPFKHSAAKDITRVEEMAKALGAEPASIDADAHDFLMAAISHVPQLVASALMKTVGERVGQSGLQHAGRGLADTTRLAACAGDWVTDVMASNADNVGQALDDLIAKLQAARGELRSREDTGRLLAEARSWRAFVRS
jgi:prephenate dehydrogenase